MLGFIVAAHHDCSMTLISDLKTYIDPSAQLLVAFETVKDKHKKTNGEHYHFCVNPMTDKQYDNFRKTILVNKMLLSGQARNGVPRQYGRIKSIRDETKLLQYTCKDKNIYSENIDLKTLQEYIEKSYPKKDSPKDFVSALMTYLDSKNSSFYLPGIDDPQYSCIELAILQYYITENIGKPVSKTTLRSLTTRYLMYHSGNLVSTKMVYEYIYSR